MQYYSSLCSAHDQALSSSAENAYTRFSEAIRSVRADVFNFFRTRCTGCYVLLKLVFHPNGCINAIETANNVLYVGKGNIERAVSHVPKATLKSDLEGMDLKELSLLAILLSQNKIGIVYLHCCNSPAAFAVEKVLISRYKEKILNTYSGHKLSLSAPALNVLDAAAVDFIYDKVSAMDFDFVHE